MRSIPGSLAAAAAMLCVFTAGADESSAAAYADKPFAPVTQQDYETFMSCYGKFAASLDAVAAFGPNTTKPDSYKEIEESGRGMAAQFILPTVSMLNDPRYGLDLAAGEAAKGQGAAVFTSLATPQEQFEMFKTNGEFSQTCIDLVETLITSTQLNASIWKDAGVPSSFDPGPGEEE